MLEESPSIVHDVSVAAAMGRRSLPQRLCAAFARSLGAQRAALSFLPRLEHWRLLHATDEPALRAEAAQFTLGDGPSVSAALRMRPVHVADLRRAPCRRRSPLREGLDDVRRMLALPMHVQRTPVGVICLYYTGETELTEARVAEGQRAAGVALDALLRWRAVHGSDDCGCPVWTTDTRAARWDRIHRAAGYLAAREECPAAEALAMLQAAGTRDGRSLLDVSDALLQPRDAHGQHLPGPRPGGAAADPAGSRAYAAVP
ncbi:GAF domain-containing protein [Streptomyces spongiicola]|uniref:GAF domain-containing protein n=1 Tax=Streptomyces spongiicola TaxID=1690221 RepID=A0A2S1Z6G9_9ACTN|nr:GAF domain-containing protein [Streptomyces spongiicola]AWK11947.1 GAF domain-containing protein [Streptomyces spongiicola]GBP99012.1 GAF domain-containing protein [Streptomyces spongiicola]